MSDLAKRISEQFLTVCQYNNWQICNMVTFDPSTEPNRVWQEMDQAGQEALAKRLKSLALGVSHGICPGCVQKSPMALELAAMRAASPRGAKTARLRRVESAS